MDRKKDKGLNFILITLLKELLQTAYDGGAMLIQWVKISGK
jgi:hypothetical protein